jgi:hypothetical protein
MNPGGVLQTQSPVDLPTMADLCDSDHMVAVIHGVDHPIVAGAHSQVWAMPREAPYARWPGIGGEVVDRLGNSLADRRVELPQRAAGSGRMSSE